MGLFWSFYVFWSIYRFQNSKFQFFLCINKSKQEILKSIDLESRHFKSIDLKSKSKSKFKSKYLNATLGICRGSQILNVACGGTFSQDIGMEISKECPDGHNVTHINYEDYDGHRHVIKVVEDTPLHHWFKDCLDKQSLEILVKSYPHQGLKRLAQHFVPKAFSPDGLVEGFYDPNAYHPQ